MYNTCMFKCCVGLLPWIGVGIMLGLPFLYEWLWGLIFVGVGYFCWLLHNYVGSFQGCMWRGWLAGIVQALFVLSWGLATYPLSWLGITSATLAIVLIGIYWIITAAVIGLSLALVALMTFLLKKSFWYLVFLPLVWVGSDLFASYMYSLLFWGAGGGHNLHFSFGTLGYPLLAVGWFDEVITHGTVYAGTALVIFFSAILFGSFYYLGKRQGYLCVFSALIVIVFVISANVFVSRPIATEETQVIISIDTRFSATLLRVQNGQYVKSSSLHEAVLSALAYNPDVIILPEDSRYIGDSINQNLVFRLLREQNSSDFILIDSGRHTNKTGQVVLRSHSFDTKSEEVFIRDKYYLTPQGEFLPYLVSGILYLSPESDWKQRIFNHLQYRSGEIVAPVIFGQSPGVLFCMESVSPWVSKQVAQSGSQNFIAHPVSHAWFTDSRGLRLQMQYMLRARALEIGLPIVKAGNMTNGYMVRSDGVIDYGKILEQTEFWSLRTFSL